MGGGDRGPAGPSRRRPGLGANRITVTAAVPAALLDPAHLVLPPAQDSGATQAPFDRPGQPTPALAPPDVRSDVATVVHALLSPAWRAVTGATVAVDGGVWMTP